MFQLCWSTESPQAHSQKLIQSFSEWVSQSVHKQPNHSTKKKKKKKRITSTRRQAASKQALCADLEHEHAASRVADDAQG